MYTIKENEGPVQPVLVLNNPSSTDVTVRIADGGGTATGKQTLLYSTCAQKANV